jgi:hypothetical protein
MVTRVNRFLVRRVADRWHGFRAPAAESFDVLPPVRSRAMSQPHSNHLMFFCLVAAACIVTVGGALVIGVPL